MYPDRRVVCRITVAVDWCRFDACRHGNRHRLKFQSRIYTGRARQRQSVSYFVPADNPYADGVDGAPEVYWTGLCNPWRFSFDFDDDGDGDVWIADVGQGDIEEVTVVRAGRSGVNLGWPVMEGSECFQSNNCDDSPYEAPVTEYTHDEGCSITGGYVYRGTAIPELEGHFFYSDFCAGFIRSYSPETGDHDWTPKTGSVPLVSGFGVGGDGELHVVSHNGSIYRFERAK